MGDEYNLNNEKPAADKKGVEMSPKRPNQHLQPSYLATNINSFQSLKQSENYECIDRYLVGALLGKGSYAKVKEVLDTKTLCRRAIKIISRKNLVKIPNGEESTLNEIKLLTSLQHENILKVFDVMTDDTLDKIYIVLEFGICNIMEMLENSGRKSYPLWQAQNYFTQLIHGLQYLHSHGIIHKDIKPLNLLLSLSEKVKICDFGTSEMLDFFAQNDNCYISSGSPAFQSPEVIQGQVPFSGTKLDIWAAGVTLYYMVFGCMPFVGENIYQLFNLISQCDIKYPTKIDRDTDGYLLDLLKSILSPDPQKRSTISEILNHSWVVVIPARSLSEKIVYFDRKDPKNNCADMTTLGPLQIFAQNEDQLRKSSRVVPQFNKNRGYSICSNLTPLNGQLMDSKNNSNRQSGINQFMNIRRNSE